MTRTLLGACAGTWVLLLVGCASTDMAGFIGLKSNGNERVIDGSLDAVAQSTRDKLLKLNLKADMNKQGETFYIYSETPKPAASRFTLVLTQEKVGQTERTRIKFQWQDHADNTMSVAILERLVPVSAH